MAADYIVVTGSTPAGISAAMAAASNNGYLVFGGIAVSASVFSVLMGRGVGSPVPLTDSTHSLKSNAPASPTSSGLWQNVFPRQTATDTLLGINTDPNVNWPYIPHNTGSFG